jgi:hypothetical protein
MARRGGIYPVNTRTPLTLQRRKNDNAHVKENNTSWSSKGYELTKSGRTHVRYKVPTNNIGLEIVVASTKVIPKIRGVRQNFGHGTTGISRGDSNGPYSVS